MKRFRLSLMVISFTFFVSIAYAQTGTLTVEISEIQGREGAISVGLYTSAENFPETEKSYNGRIIKVTGEKAVVTFEDIPAGTYAIAVFHDTNLNGKLDTNFLGIPNEGYAFSNNVLGTFGPPDFEDASFKLDGNKTVEIKMGYQKGRGTMKFIIKYLPFAGIIAINSLAIAGRFRLESLKPYVFIISAVVLLNLIIAIAAKVKSYFNYGISGIVILGAFSVFLVPSLGQIYLENVITALYVGLFSVALFPPLFNLDPFTYEFSKKNYPEAITKTDQFRKINIIINYIWAALFGSCIILSTIKYSDDGGIQVIISSIVPIVLLLAVGIPINRKLPGVLMQTTQGEQLHFESIKELFEAMPFGLNKGLAEGLDAIIQFHLTGEEPTDGYLIIKNLECTYTEGTHPDPKTTIRSDSKLWLGISNNEISGDQAFLNKQYAVEGDMTVLLKLGELFGPSGEPEADVKQKPKKIDFEYKTFEPERIKKIVVFDGGPRNTKFSKTTFMVNHFCRGARSAGAEVEYVKLKDMEINPCTGCFTCWTKTPGECIFKDDMTDLRLKYRKADLVVFASPLYIFSVTGIMKNFLDRIVPNMKPYMLIENGETKHPHRYPEDRQQGFVVFSAAGFPEVEHNFDGLKGMFRCLHSHSEQASLMGEFYMPGAELIAQPVYGERRMRVEQACYDAGEQVVKNGKMDIACMETVSDPGVSQKKFQEQADYFWGSLDGKGSYLKSSHRLEYANVT